MPYGCEKQKLFVMYGRQMSDENIRTAINAIIATNRKFKTTANIRVKKVWHKELVEFVEIHGLPDGYKHWDEK